jgi:hypothetical protein
MEAQNPSAKRNLSGACGWGRCGCFCRRGKSQKKYGQQHARRGIAEQDHAETLQRWDRPRLQVLHEHAAYQRSCGGGERAGQVMPGERPGPFFRGDGLCQRRLLNRQERTHFISARAEHSDGRSQQQQ